jgi:hypothetical protein
MRTLLKHDDDFRGYMKQNPTKNKTAINFSIAPVGGASRRKTRRLMFNYPAMNEIKQNVTRIHKSQKKAICQTYESLRETKDNIFSEENIGKNKTIMRTLKKTIKK